MLRANAAKWERLGYETAPFLKATRAIDPGVWKAFGKTATNPWPKLDSGKIIEKLRGYLRTYFPSLKLLSIFPMKIVCRVPGQSNLFFRYAPIAGALGFASGPK